MTSSKHVFLSLTCLGMLLASLVTAASAAETLVGNPSNTAKITSSADKSDSPNRSKRMTNFALQGQDAFADKQSEIPDFSELNAAEADPGKYLDEDDDDHLDKSEESDPRKNIFVRIGRGDSHSADQIYSDDAETVKRASHFMRIGKSPSSFVRIGKSEIGNNENVDKRASSFVRIGKAPSSFVRIGRASSGFVRIGKAPSSFVRIGRAPSNFVRIGKAPSNFVRIGKSGDAFDENDVNTDYAQEADNYEKRASSFVRIGKAPSSFVRIGKADQIADNLGADSNENNKRASRFVRIGKSGIEDEINDAKRASSFVRIGKSALKSSDNSDSQKRASSFVRIGKSLPSKPSESFLDQIPEDSQNPIKVDTRGSAFVRIGKIPSSAFVRIGKNNGLLIDELEGNRNTRGSQSSFVRIGK